MFLEDDAMRSEYSRMVARRGHARRMEEYTKGMNAKGWDRIRIKGINPYAIDRVVGIYLVEFNPRTGKSLPWNECYDVEVVAYDLRLTDGTTRRFSRLIDAKDYARMLIATNGKGVTT